MKIKIKSICGKSINLEDVTLDTTINELLITCSRELNMRKEKIKLVYAGICIDRMPEKTIAEIRIPDNAVIHLADNKYVPGEDK